MRNRIAIFVPDLRGGGAERSMVNLAIGFHELGLEVDMVLAKATGTYLPLIPAGVNIVDLGTSRTLLAFPGLVKYLRARQPEALLSALDHANVVALIAKRFVAGDIRYSIGIRNNFTADAQVNGSLYARIIPGLARRIFPTAHEIITVSGGVADDLAEATGIPRSRMTVIYNPVVSESLLEQSRQAPDHPWFQDPEGLPIVLAAGRLTVQKDYPTLLRAFAKVRAGRSARLVILGDGGERPKLEALANDLGIAGDLSLAGFQENPFAYMSRAGVFVLASKFEGLPGVLIQAMACGAPVVSTDCPNGPSEVLDGGKWGPLVPVGDVDRLADAIDSVLARRAAGEDLSVPPVALEPYELIGAARRHAEVVLGRKLDAGVGVPELRRVETGAVT